MGVTVILGSILLMGLSACAKQEPADELERIRMGKHLYIAIQPINSPFGFSAGTQITGFDAELAEAISRKINVPIRWVPKSFGELFDTLASKRADMIISVISVTEQRKEKFAFSEPYFQSGQILAIRKDTEKEIKGIDALKGKRVGVQEQATSHLLAKTDPRLQEAKLVTFDSPDSALLGLNGKELDAVIGGFPVLVESISKSFPNLEVIGKPLDNELKAVVLRKGEDKLLQLVNETIRELKSQGKLEEMEQRWFKAYQKVKDLQGQVPGKPIG